MAPFRSSLLGSDPFLSLHREVNRLFDDVFRGEPSSGGNQRGVTSFINTSMNVSETENELRVTAELPGVSQGDVDVMLQDDVLTIRGEKKFEQKDEKENFHFVERSYGTFQRSIRLPFPADPEQVQANFENGVLSVTLPKSSKQERSRKIEVRSGSNPNDINAEPKKETGSGQPSVGASKRK
jgi:HSP20 family protein